MAIPFIFIANNFKYVIFSNIKRRFHEIWYIKSHFIGNVKDHIHILNFHVMTSFFTTQVNAITAIWLFFVVVGYHKINSNNSSIIWRNLVLNWNFLMMIGFLIGIIFGSSRLGNELVNTTKWTVSQSLVTIIVHFVVPGMLLFIYFFEGGNYYNFKRIYLNWSELLSSTSFPLFYITFILVRAKVYSYDKFVPFRFIYGFLNVENPLIGNSTAGYIIILFILFSIFSILVQLFIFWINNLAYKLKRRKVVIVDGAAPMHE